MRSWASAVAPSKSDGVPKPFRRLSRRLTTRQRIWVLLAACITLGLAINWLTRVLRPPPPPQELPKLAERSQMLYNMGIVDGDASNDTMAGTTPPSTQHLRSASASNTSDVPKSWSWLKDTQAAPTGALLLPGYALDPGDQNPSVVGKHVRVLWIGDLANAPLLILNYIERGFNMTVHTSVDNILEGFVPHVRRAYERAIPRVAGFDFLKLLILYKYGGFVVDADTMPLVDVDHVVLPHECDVLLGKETHLGPDEFVKPIYRRKGGPTYGFNRPYQLLNWAMIATKVRNRHIEEFILASMRHFFGMRDIEKELVQDIAGSGMLSDYVALLHEQHGIDYAATFENRKLMRPIEGICMLENELRSRWILHTHMATWYAEK